MLSRDADSLYWMSRYLERAEHTARLIDVNVVLMLDQSPAQATERWTRLLASLHTPPPEYGADDPRAITGLLAFDRSNRTSIIASIEAARNNARQVRELISSEMWEQINHLFLRISRANIDDIWNTQPHAFFRSVRDGTHLFQGIADATMSRGEGWQFMEVGRFIERASKTAALLDTYFPDYLRERERRDYVSDYLDWVGLLKSRTAFEAYCQVYTADVRPERIAEFLLLNADFPHTVRFSVERIQAGLEAIGRANRTRNAGAVERLAGRMRAELEYAQIDDIMVGDMHAYLRNIEDRCDEIHAMVHQIYHAPPLESILG
ncbi:MAG TPA: alpha-E domain-containing protein [Herpetosiphonaceae bacterium]|nr:alpha-E domain-containing protein [Herpetosiphonaceae bacterium]